MRPRSPRIGVRVNFDFYVCIQLFCLHVWGLRWGVLGFSGLRGGIHPDCFYMFVFWLKCPFKKRRNRKCIHKAVLENDPISEELKMGLFVVLWILSSLWGHFHRANRETHYQPAPERSEPELSSPSSPSSPFSCPPPTLPRLHSVVPPLTATPGPHSGLLAQNIFSSDWACPYCLQRSGSSQGLSA